MPFLAGRRFKLSRFDGVPSASFTLPAGEDGESVGSGLESLYFAAPLSAVSTEVRGVLVVGVPDSVLPLYWSTRSCGPEKDADTLDRSEPRLPSVSDSSSAGGG